MGDGSAGALIGSRLRAARLSRRKTLTEVALACGLTKSFVSKLERDQANASVASLIRLCQVLEISIASLFEAHNGELVRTGEYPRINFGGEAFHHGSAASEVSQGNRRARRSQRVLS